MYRPGAIYRLQLTVVILGIILGLAYFAGFSLLSNKTAALDKTVLETWEKLLAINQQYQTRLGIDLLTVTESRLLAEKSMSAMLRSVKHLRERIELAPEQREKLRQPFQLVELYLTRNNYLAEARQLAEARKVAMEGPVVTGFPENQISQAKPAQLWPELILFDLVLKSALVCSPASIKSLDLLPGKTFPAIEPGRGELEEYPFRITMTGSMESMANFLFALPLLNEELRQCNLPEAAPRKPALFLKNLVLKSTFKSPQEVQLDAIVSGFISRELNP